MKLRGALIAATMMALPMAANAQAVNGLYVGAGLGINMMHTETIKSIGGAGVTASGLQSRLGPAVVLSGGWGFGNGLRAELEGSYRHNTINGISNAGATTSFGGPEQKYGVMVNALYDFVGLVPAIQPYVGLGLGYQFAQVKASGAVGGIPYAIGLATKGAFAYQAIVGAALPIDSAPGLALTAEYRFMGMLGDRSYTGTVAGASASTSLGGNYNHSLLLGLRYNFGAAPVAAPMAQAAPAAQAARSFLVFFDWDKATLTDRARGIIKDAADTSRKVQHTRIEVNGYTDSSGTTTYNQGLSVRRAQAVAAELVKNGVNRNEISIQGYGDTRQLVPTGPNTREPQNRRVEIIIR